jgi:NodT family efflux transporter outer membrane factor (OMF) lipoprotein
MKGFVSFILVLFLSLPAFAGIDTCRTKSCDNISFIENFKDAYLSDYVCEGLGNNHDWHMALWRVEEYRQNVKVSFSRELPSLSVGAYYNGFHFPGTRFKENSFVLPFIANYEADLLLKNRDRTRAAKKSYEAAQFQAEAVYILLISDIATVYINLLQYDSLIERQGKVVALNEELMARAGKMFARGVIDHAGLNAVKKNLETEKNNLDELCKQRETTLTQFALLLGRTPGGDFARSRLNEFEYRAQIPSEVPSDVIFSRPDVLAAEAQLESARINVRVARKEFLPTFNILGLLVFNTFLPGNFFNWDSIIASIFAGATQDIFRGGLRFANLRVNQARYQQLFEMYRQTDLNAVKEVNDALVIIKIDTQTDQNTIEKLRLQSRDFADAQKKFNRGVVSYPDLLAAQQELLNMQQNQIQTKATRLVNYLTLYKAVGGKL